MKQSSAAKCSENYITIITMASTYVLLLCFHNKVSCPFLPETETSNEAQNQLEVPLESGICAVPLHSSSF